MYVIPNKLHSSRHIMRVYCTLNHMHRPILPRKRKYLYKYVSHILSHLQSTGRTPTVGHSQQHNLTQ